MILVNQHHTERTGQVILKLWLRCGDKAEPESTTAIARQDFYTDFDGTDDYVSVADNDDLYLGQVVEHLVTGWINMKMKILDFYVVKRSL